MRREVVFDKMMEGEVQEDVEREAEEDFVVAQEIESPCFKSSACSWTAPNWQSGIPMVMSSRPVK